ncbi:hypothetical protein LEMLEM_LOCUS26521, partial [Lemmus lemmus]
MELLASWAGRTKDAAFQESGLFSHAAVLGVTCAPEKSQSTNKWLTCRVEWPPSMHPPPHRTHSW